MSLQQSSSDVMTATAPPLGDADARAILNDIYGVTASALSPLYSERDQNIRVTTADGTIVILKIANPAEPFDVTDLQTQALIHLEKTAPALPVPRVVKTRDGKSSYQLRRGDTVQTMRLLSYLDGRPAEDSPLNAAFYSDFGQRAAELDKALACFTHSAAAHRLLWDPLNALEIIPYLDAVPAVWRGVAADVLSSAADIVSTLRELPPQTIHGDLNPQNVLAGPAGDRVAGIIDFGDCVQSRRLCEVAIAAAYLVEDSDRPLASAQSFVAGYQSISALTADETPLLLPVIRLRLAMSLVINAWRMDTKPENRDYMLKRQNAAARKLQRLQSCREV